MWKYQLQSMAVESAIRIIRKIEVFKKRKLQSMDCNQDCYHSLYWLQPDYYGNLDTMNYSNNYDWYICSEHHKFACINIFQIVTIIKVRQIISDFFKITFPPKTSKQIQLYYYDTLGPLVFVRFLEETEDTKKLFQTFNLEGHGCPPIRFVKLQVIALYNNTNKMGICKLDNTFLHIQFDGLLIASTLMLLQHKTILTPIVDRSIIMKVSATLVL